MTANLSNSSEPLSSEEEVPSHLSSTINYLPFPYPLSADEATGRPVWRVHFEVLSSPGYHFGLDINSETILGRGSGTHALFDMTPYGAENNGMSRRHAMLRPTQNDLYIIDLESTNGTMYNGRPLSPNIPFPLNDGDVLMMSQLEVVIHIISKPHVPLMSAGSDQNNLAEALSHIAKAITSQLELDDVLNQVADLAMRLTAAGETSIWLVDQATGELFLEAERGIRDEKVRRIRLPIHEDNLAGRVVQTGKPIRASRQPGEDQIKLKTYYLVEAVVNVPITYGKTTIGVLTAVHREIGKGFTEQDEQLLAAIADFAAIAIQNARLFEATDQQLERRVRELAALNEISRSMSSSLDIDQVYEVLVKQLNKHWPVETVYLHLLDTRHNLLIPVEAKQAAMQPQKRSTARGILGHVVQEGLSFVNNHVGTHPYYDPEVDDLNGQTPNSIVCVPLQLKGRVVGLLTLINKTNGAFTNEDVNLLEAFASPIATAIENARLYKESNRRWGAIKATAYTLSQPLIILDENGDILVANETAQHLLDQHLAQVFEAISRSVGRTMEATIGNQTFLTTTEHLEEVGTIAVMQDITYVKELEKDRSDMIHALSHDLKNPLTSIKGWTQLLQKLPLEEKAERYVRQILISTDRMTDMIGQLLTSLTHTEPTQVRWQSCDLSKIVQTILQDVEGAALGKSITIAYEPTGRPFLIRADEKRMYHMILNLVDNAIKYSPANTHIKLRLHFSHEAIGIQVQDEGPGILEKDMPHIFEKYYRSEATKAEIGSGIGLSAVKAVVDTHNGRINVRNLPDRGTEFTIMLPGSLRLEMN